MSRATIDIEPLYATTSAIASQFLGLPPSPDTMDLGYTPFSITNAPWFKAILDKGYPIVLLKTARQVGKSVGFFARAFGYMSTIPGFKSMYGAPTNTDLHTFSDEKLKDFHRFSPIINDYFMKGPDTKDSFSRWVFRNGSSLTLRNAARGGANFRGPTNDLIGIDEMQCMPTEAIPIARKTLLRSSFRYEIYSGTPLTMDNPIQGMWDRSTQAEWYVRCYHCSGGDRNYYVIVGLKNFTPMGLICDRCGKLINPLDGMWVEHYPTSEIKGFRIPQGLGDWTDYRDLYWNTIKTEPIHNVHNEVLGLSYDSAVQFLSMKELRDAVDPRIELVSSIPENLAMRKTFIGIDWSMGGGCFTSFVVGLDLDGIHWAPLMMRIIPHGVKDGDHFGEIIVAIDTFRVNMVVADVGVHGDRNFRIADHMGDPQRVVQCQYVYSPEYMGKFFQETRKLNVGKPMALTSFKTDMVTRKNVRLPSLDQIPEFVQHLIAEKVETNRMGFLQYILPSGRNDDGLMAMVYANMAHRILRGMPPVDDVYMGMREEQERKPRLRDAW